MSSDRGAWKIPVLVLAALLTAQLACGISLGDGEDQPATVQALASSVAATATARTFSEISPQEALRTSQAKATEAGVNAAGTSTAQAQVSAAERAATATAFAPYVAELPNYGVDPNNGRPGWIHPPVELVLEGHMQNDAQNYFIFTIAEDFVVSADITWNTRFGTAGCGFVIRSNGDQEAPDQYMVLATRAALGHVAFLTLADGEIANLQDLYPASVDPNFDWHNDTTNQLTVVGRDKIMEVYTNGVKIGEFDVTSRPPPPVIPAPPATPSAEQESAYQATEEAYQEEVDQIKAEYQRRLRVFQETDTFYERGIVALLALSESGRTVCRFENAWMWLIEE